MRETRETRESRETTTDMCRRVMSTGGHVTIHQDREGWQGLLPCQGPLHCPVISLISFMRLGGGGGVTDDLTWAVVARELWHMLTVSDQRCHMLTLSLCIVQASPCHTGEVSICTVC